MESLYLQIVVVVFVLFAISRAFLRFKGSEINGKEFMFWSLVWVIVLIVVFLPQTAELLANFFGIGRGIDVFVYSGLVLLFYLVFRLYVKIEGVEQELTNVVRTVALKNLKKKSNEKRKKKG